MVITVVSVALVVLLNVIVSALSDRYNMSFDLTPGGDFEISEKTLNYLAVLNEDVEICTTVDELRFQTTDNKYYRQAYEVLKKYALNSDRISLNFVDMTVDPTYVEKYKQYYSGSINEYSIIVFNKESHRIRVVSVDELFNIETDYYTWTQSIVSSKAEQVVTSALMYVTDPDPKTAVYLDVVTQSQNGGNITDMLSANGFDIVTVDPNTDEIPMDADLIIVNSPLNDFSEKLIGSLYEFMENGGNYGKNMIYLASTAQKATPNIDAFLAEWGLVVEDGVAAESNQYNLFQATPYALVAYVEENEYTGGIPSETFSNPVAVYFSRPISIRFDNLGNVSTKILLKTSETGCIVTREMRESGDASQLSSQSVNVMALANKYVFDANNNIVLSNLVVVGTDDILNKGVTEQTYYNNGDYFVSIVNVISGKENGISIVAKDLSSATFDKNEATTSKLRIVFMFVLPALVAAAGITVWLKRRHK